MLGGIAGVIIGIAVAVLTIAAFAPGIGFGLLAIGPIVGLSIAGYAGAAAARGTAFGDFLKGVPISFNAGLTAVFATAIFGPVVGVGLGIIVFLGVFGSLRQSTAYQVVLGWSSWLMPTTWLTNRLGLASFAVNLRSSPPSSPPWPTTGSPSPGSEQPPSRSPLSRTTTSATERAAAPRRAHEGPHHRHDRGSFVIMGGSGARCG